jgi:hypothetical protein
MHLYRLRQLAPLLALAAGLVLAGDDTTPPELKAIQFTPAAIDTSGGAAEVTVTFSVTDDLSGASYFEVSFLDPSSAHHQTAFIKFAPTLSGTNSVKVNFPHSSMPGAWTLAKIMVADAAGNTLVLDADGLSGRGFPTRLEMKSSLDTTSPKLAALEISPAQIDTSKGPAEVKINYTATDDLSGVTYLELSFLSPSGVSRRGATARIDAAPSVSNSITVNFPALSEPGQWKLESVLLSDAARNTLVLDTDALTGSGFPTALNVRSATDTTSPTLTGLRFTPESVDTSAGPATVNVQLTATDDLSGVNYLEVSFMSTSGISLGGAAKVDANTSVSAAIPVTFPPRSESGQWVLKTVFLSDASGNTQILDAAALAASGMKTNLEVRSATTAATGPKLDSLHVSPESIDTSRGPAVVNIDFAASGEQSPITRVEVSWISPSGAVRVAGVARFDPGKSVNASVPVNFAAGSEPGQWTLSAVFLADAAGNTITLDADALASRVPKLQVR